MYLIITRKDFLEKKTTTKAPLNLARVAILVGDTSSRLVLHFYQVSSKYCDGYSSCRADTKSNLNTRRGDKSKSNKARVVILVPNMSSHPVLHFYLVSSKYSEGYSCNRVNTKSNSNQTGGGGVTTKVRKPKLSFLYVTCRLILFYISTKCH